MIYIIISGYAIIISIISSCKVQRRSEGVEVTSATTKASVSFNPFQMEFYVNNEIAVILNSRGLTNFEQYRAKR